MISSSLWRDNVRNTNNRSGFLMPWVFYQLMISTAVWRILFYPLWMICKWCKWWNINFSTLKSITSGSVSEYTYVISFSTCVKTLICKRLNGWICRLPFLTTQPPKYFFQHTFGLNRLAYLNIQVSAVHIQFTLLLPIYHIVYTGSFIHFLKFNKIC